MPNVPRLATIIATIMKKHDRIAIVNLHHGLGQCRKDAWVQVAPYLSEKGLCLTFREISTLQSVHRYELTNETQLNLADLARRIQLKNAITSQTVSSLVEKGLMRRENDSDNRRKIMISLSEKGREVAEDIAVIADGYLDKYLSALTDAERAALFKIAAKLNPTFPY